MAGGEVEELLVNFFEAPVGLEGEEAGVTGRAEGAEVGAPIDFAETDGRASRDVRGGERGVGPGGSRGGVAEGVFDVKVEEAGSEANEVGGRGGSGAGDVEDVARIPDGADTIGRERGDDRERFVGRGGEAGMFVFHAEADAGAGGECDEAVEVLNHALLFRGLGGMGCAEKREDAEEVGVELVGDLEAAFENVAVGGDRGGVVEIALKDGRGAPDDAPAFGAGGGDDLGDIGPREVFEGAAVEATEFDAGEAEFADEGGDDGKVLGDFVGDDCDVVGKFHGRRAEAEDGGFTAKGFRQWGETLFTPPADRRRRRWWGSLMANGEMTGGITSRRLF